ncbi:solute carrier organic anion transporter family member 74D [Musca domestica]|uniref:Solute carrier organic anion transporter family member n=1 Tax=Musca domestica TaxID=7370 RepID=A0A1I8N5P2_MUSDO|nr:solute carrier organic anion transporter family member 74D [Musca domestica]
MAQIDDNEQNDPESKKTLLDKQKSVDPQEVKRILKEMPLTEDTTCGFGCVKGSFLQRFANQTSYVIIYGLVGCVFSMTNSYFHGTISTLEKRFKIPSRNTGMIMIGNDLSQVLCSAVLGYYAGKKHRPRWMGFGLLTLIAFCMLTVTPHFIYGPGEDALSLTKEYGGVSDINISMQDLEEQRKKILCRNDGTGVECEVREGSLLPQILLFIAQFVAGVGGSLYYSLGVSYMDDNTEKAKAPAMLSISYFFGLLGPSLGYTLASLCLRVYIAPNLTPIINMRDSRWLGAWWMGWLITAGLLFFFGLFMFMFPKELPMTAARRKAQNLRAKEENMGVSVEQIQRKTSFMDMLKTFKLFYKSKIIRCNILSNTFYFFGYTPYWIFTAKYIEIQYRQSASTSSMATGTVALVFSAVGVLLSGVVISKFKPSARYLAAWNILVDIVTLTGMIIYIFIGCAANDNSLINNPNESVLNTTLSCNSVCHCDYVRYMPVCGEDQRTYISPCHAGCKGEYMDAKGVKSYYDCSCIPTVSNHTLNTNPLFELVTMADLNNSTMNGNNLSLGTGGQAMAGACPVNCSNQFISFLVVMCTIKFFAATGRAANMLITMRSVAPENKSALMGFGMMFISLVCFVPGPILFGWIFDKNCLVWGKTCTNKGNCWLYDSANLRLSLNVVGIFFITISTICNGGVWYHVKHLKVFDDEEDDVGKEMKIVASNNALNRHENE